MKKIIDISRRKKRRVSSEDFIARVKKDKESIVSSRFIPANFGSEDFGHFEIEIKNNFFSADWDYAR